MKRCGTFLSLMVLAGVLLMNTGCVRMATAPIRAERREKAEAALDRLAQLTPEQIAGFLDNRMAAQLALTEAQKPKVGAINLEHAGKLHAIAASEDGVRTKARALSKQNDAHEAALKPVLTAEQFAQFLTMKEAMREALKDMRSGK